MPCFTILKALKYPRSSSWHLAELLCYAEADTGQVVSWNGLAGVLTILPDLWNQASCIRENERKKAGLLCTQLWAGTVVELMLRWHEWDPQGLRFIWTHASPDQVLFSTGCEFRKSHALGYYLEYNLLQKCVLCVCLWCNFSFLFIYLFNVWDGTWMLIKLLSTFLIFAVSCSSLAQVAEFCILALQRRYWCRNPRRAREN